MDTIRSWQIGKIDKLFAHKRGNIPINFKRTGNAKNLDLIFVEV